MYRVFAERYVCAQLHKCEDKLIYQLVINKALLFSLFNSIFIKTVSDCSHSFLITLNNYMELQFVILQHNKIIYPHMFSDVVC